MRKYSNDTAARVCVTAIRQLQGFDAKGLQLPFSEEAMRAARELLECKDRPREHSDRIHALLVAVVGKLTKEAVKDRRLSVVEDLLALGALKADGTFDGPLVVTSQVAKWFYCLRVVALHECERLEARGAFEDIDE